MRLKMTDHMQHDKTFAEDHEWSSYRQGVMCCADLCWESVRNSALTPMSLMCARSTREAKIYSTQLLQRPRIVNTHASSVPAHSLDHELITEITASIEADVRDTYSYCPREWGKYCIQSCAAKCE